MKVTLPSIRLFPGSIVEKIHKDHENSEPDAMIRGWALVQLASSPFRYSVIFGTWYWGE